MRYLPVHIDLLGQTIIVIGGEGAAEAKLRTLIKTPAKIIVLAETISDEIKKWADEAQGKTGVKGLADIELIERAIDLADMAPLLKGARLIYAATEDDGLNSEIAALGAELGILVNAADQKQACDFITPALVDRSPVVVSIGTEGTSPSLARAIKTDLEAKLPSDLGFLANKINGLRAFVKKNILSLSERQRFWAGIFGTKDLYGQIRLSPEQLETKVKTALKVSKESETGLPVSQKGHVILVGAGPGDPDLLTLKARQKLHSADVIIYDRLVSQGVLDFGRREAEYLYVGKTPGGVSISQTDINDILVEKALKGLMVVRLKSGDPLIFGRADEEFAALNAAGISYEIVPGITSAFSAAAQIGVSLTTRGTNKAITLMTGHDAKGFAEHDWKGLISQGGRAAVYMGVGAARFIQGRLMLHGAAKDLPVTVVENASRANQIVVATTLENLIADMEKAAIVGPAILLVGYAPNQSDINSVLEDDNAQPVQQQIKKEQTL